MMRGRDQDCEQAENAADEHAGEVEERDLYAMVSPPYPTDSPSLFPWYDL